PCSARWSARDTTARSTRWAIPERMTARARSTQTPPGARSWEERCRGATAAGSAVVREAVRLPAGTGFDPGGIGKGLAADIVVDEIRADGADGVCVNPGGDVRVDGPSPATNSAESGKR